MQQEKLSFAYALNGWPPSCHHVETRADLGPCQRSLAVKYFLKM